MRLDALSTVRQHNATFKTPPLHVPTRHVVDGPILGNRDVGIALGGPSGAQRCWISKCGFWKAKPRFPNGGPRPIVGIDLFAPSLEAAGYHIEQRLCEANTIATFQTPASTLSMHSRVAADENLLVITLGNTGAPIGIQSRLWAQEGNESTVQRGREGESAS
jgi:hypothetical protein